MYCESEYEEKIEEKQAERQNIQGKTFTRWVKYILSNRAECKSISDIFKDFKSGVNLCVLADELTGRRTLFERGRMRIHCIGNVNSAFATLSVSDFDSSNIQAENIVDGDKKLTLGLVWKLILHFQVLVTLDDASVVKSKEALILWAEDLTANYEGVQISNLTTSFKDGLAITAIAHSRFPNKVDFNGAKKKTPIERWECTTQIIQDSAGVPKLLDAEDVVNGRIDELSMMTYLGAIKKETQNFNHEENEFVAKIKEVEKDDGMIQSKMRNFFQTTTSPELEDSMNSEVGEFILSCCNAVQDLKDKLSLFESNESTEENHLLNRIKLIQKNVQDYEQLMNRFEEIKQKVSDNKLAKQMMELISKPLNADFQDVLDLIRFYQEADAFEKWMCQEASSSKLLSNVSQDMNKHAEMEVNIKDLYSQLKTPEIPDILATTTITTITTETARRMNQYAEDKWKDLSNISEHFKEHCRRISEVQTFWKKLETVEGSIRKQRMPRIAMILKKAEKLDLVTAKLKHLNDNDEEISRLKDIAKELYPYEERWKLLSNKSYDVHYLLSNQPAGKLIDISDSQMWKVRTSDGNQIEIESIFLSLLPPNTEALKKVEELTILIGKIKCDLLKIKVKIGESPEDQVEHREMKAKVLEDEAIKLMNERKNIEASKKLLEGANLLTEDEDRQHNNIATAINIETYHNYIHGKISSSYAEKKFKIAEQIARSNEVLSSIRRNILLVLKQRADLLCMNSKKVQEAIDGVQTWLNHAELFEIDENEITSMRKKKISLRNQDQRDEIKKEIEREIFSNIEGIKKNCDEGRVDDAQDDFKVLLTSKLYGFKDAVIGVFVKIYESLIQRGNVEEAKKFFKEDQKRLNLETDNPELNQKTSEIRKSCNDYRFGGIIMFSFVNLNTSSEHNKAALGSKLTIVSILLVLLIAYSFLLKS